MDQGEEVQRLRKEIERLKKEKEQFEADKQQLEERLEAEKQLKEQSEAEKQQLEERLEAEKQLKEQGLVNLRLEQLSNTKKTEIPHFPGLSSKSRSNSGKVLEHCTPSCDADIVWANIPVHEREGELYAHIRLLISELTPPPEDADENSVVHPFVKKMLNLVQRQGRVEGIRVHDFFHEHENAVGTSDRTDLVFVQQGVQVHLPLTLLWMLELKTYTRPENGPLREAVAQCISRLAARSKSLSDSERKPTCGIAVSTNTRNLVITRINFTYDAGKGVYFPVFISPPLPFIAAPTAAAAATATGQNGVAIIQDGLRALLRLMLVDAREPFGLAEFSKEVPESLCHVGLLGSGGFANVHCVTYKDDATHSFAFKRMRVDPTAITILDHAGAAVDLAHEVEILTALNKNKVSHVPTLIQHFPLTGFLLTPVGVSLPQFMVRHPKRNDVSWRLGLALRVLKTLEIVFKATHRMSVLHMDVRPDNILVLPSGTDAQEAADFVLIDWGLAKSAGQRTDAFVFGSRCFLADTLLQCQKGSQSVKHRQLWTPTAAMDHTAALFTFVSIVASETANAPWNFNVPIEWLTHIRITFISALQGALQGLDLWLKHILEDYLTTAQASRMTLKKLADWEVMYGDIVASPPPETLLQAIWALGVHAAS